MSKVCLYNIVTIILFTLSSSCLAKTYDNHNLGFSISIDDYFSQISHEGNIHAFTSADNDSAVIIKNRPGLSFKQVQRIAKLGYQEEGVALVAQGDAEELTLENGQGLKAAVDGFIGQSKVKGMLGAYAGEQGQGFIILLAATPEAWEKTKSHAEELFNSIRFIKKASVQYPDNWPQYLTGKRLILRNIHDDSSAAEDYYLCSNGDFLQSSSLTNYNSAAGITMYGQSSNKNSGRWSIENFNGKAHLVLDYDSGTSEILLLDNRKGRTLLNGAPYFVVNNNRCR